MLGVLFEEARQVVEVSPNRADIACFIGFINRRREFVPEPVAAWLQRRGWPDLPKALKADLRLNLLRDPRQVAPLRQWLLAHGWPNVQQEDVAALRSAVIKAADEAKAAQEAFTKAESLTRKAENLAELAKAVESWLRANGWPTALPAKLTADRSLVDLADAPGLTYVREWLLANGWPNLELLDSPPGDLLVRTPLSPDARAALIAGGWRELGKNVRDDDDLRHKPVVVESFAAFARLFDWENRADTGRSTWMGAAVRSFFAQGGARCFIVRAGDVGAFAPSPAPEALALAANVQLERLRALIPSHAGGPVSSSSRQEDWRGIEVLRGLEEAALVCLPDLPELVSDATLAPAGLQPLPPVPEEFVECSTVLVPSVESSRILSTSPACREEGYRLWFRAANAAARFVKENRRDVQLILAVPLPAEGSAAGGNLIRRLEEPGLAASLDETEGIATAFLQLAFPWLGTDGSAALPGELEPPDGVLAGVVARTVASVGAHRSLGRQPLHRVNRFFPPLTARDTQLLTARGDAPALIHRVSLLGQSPNGASLLSDVTTSLDVAHRPASVGRLTAAILRTARRLGEEVVFDTSGAALWRKIETRLTTLLSQFYRAGALQGESPEQAFSVRCDETTMTPNDHDNGRVVAEVKFAPAHPVGLITVTLSLRAGSASAEATEERDG